MTLQFPDLSATNLRAAKIADVPALHELRVSSVRQSWVNWYSPREIRAWCRQMKNDYYCRALAEPLNRLLVRDEPHGIAGFAHLDLTHQRLSGLYVSPEYMGRGLGRLLLSAAEEAAKQCGIRKLRVTASLSALNFYLAHAYEPLVFHHFRLPGGVTVRSVRMTKVCSSANTSQARIVRDEVG